ncbi:MAG: hypothetical protein JWP81_3049 [Ferruginibacter sp.]|nr:hypothetical protein [Ferruginibacter sp.]
MNYCNILHRAKIEIMNFINQQFIKNADGFYITGHLSNGPRCFIRRGMARPGAQEFTRLLGKAINIMTILLCLVVTSDGIGQPVVTQKKFFKEDDLITMTLVSDFKKLVSEKLKKADLQKYQPATITCIFADGSKLTEEIQVKARGQFRRSECYIPPLMVNFKTDKAVGLKKLGHLKLVWPCAANYVNEQLVLKEYLVYKMYNLLTQKSFRVRLVKITYQDIEKRIKSRTQFAFFIEDVEAMAKRNDCMEVKDQSFHTERTDRKLTTIVALFEYMIGNTDWAVPIYRNVKLMRSENDSSQWPFVVPYDFDYCGLVNAGYAIPIPELNINSVRERLYRGFPRTMEELQEALQIFLTQRKAMDSLISNFEPLLPGHRKEMLKYLDAFFNIISDEKDVKRIFIDGAKFE